MNPFAIFASMEPIRQDGPGHTVALVAVVFLGLVALVPPLIPLLMPLVHRLTNVQVHKSQGEEMKVDVKFGGSLTPPPTPKAKRTKNPEKARHDVRKASVERKRRAKQLPPPPPDPKAT